MRSTLGVLNSCTITTFATKDGVRRVFARTCITRKATDTACGTRGVKTKGLREIQRNFQTSRFVKVMCSIIINDFLFFTKGCFTCLFVSSGVRRILPVMTVCMGYITLFFVPLCFIGMLQGKVRKVKCNLLPVVTNITRLTKEKVATAITTKGDDCVNAYLTDPIT